MKRLALLTAIAVGIASFALLRRQQASVIFEARGGRPVAVLVAATPISLGETIRSEQLAVRTIPESYLEHRHVLARHARDLVGVTASMAIDAGESILWTDLSTNLEERRTLSSLVPTGRRAVTVHLARGSGLGGLLRPGDRIDLLLHTRSDGPTAIVPILQNVLVLAVGAEMGATEVESQTFASEITLSVSIREAAIALLAQEEGDLSAALRHPQDVLVQEEASPRTLQTVLAEDEPGLAVRRTPSSSAPSMKEIEHVR